MKFYRPRNYRSTV